MLFDLVHEKKPESFEPGQFASCDLFMDMFINQQTNRLTALANLFQFEEIRALKFPLHPDENRQPITTRSLMFLTVTGSLFSSNNLGYKDADELMRCWASPMGLILLLGLRCRDCAPLPPQEPKSKSSSKTNKAKRKNEPNADVEVLRDSQIPEDSGRPQLQGVTCLNFTPGGRPLHVYIHLEPASILDQAKRYEFMGSSMWPPKLDLGGEVYTLMAQGYWNGGHYYFKVVRKSGSVIGVWLHNDMEHGGNPQLIGAKPEAIGGVSPNTSWLLYSRGWMADEEDYVNKKIQGVAKDNPNCAGDILFQHLSALLSQTGTTEMLETSLLGGLDSNLDSKDHLGSSNKSDH
jgi:hypothetical protein